MNFPVTISITEQDLRDKFDIYGSVVRLKGEPIDAEVWVIYKRDDHGRVILVPERDAYVAGIIPGNELTGPESLS